MACRGSCIENVHSTDKQLGKQLICNLTLQNITRDALNATFCVRICIGFAKQSLGCIKNKVEEDNGAAEQ